MIKYVLALIVIALSAMATAAADYVVSGIVADNADGTPLAFATIKADDGNNGTNADADGRWALLLPQGKHSITISYVGYTAATVKVDLAADTTLRTTLAVAGNALGEVVVTASENRSLTSGSRIDRAAMAHLQPTSFTDLLELIPGNISKTPAMGQVNSITLRETGFSASGATSVTDDYAISSLGTSFVVDGVAINTDASLTSVPGATSGDAAYLRTTVNRGVDMRTISTDNIESVEVMRGIPSAEYGNLTSGVVNIKRIRRATPWTARFKADEYSKLMAVGKGFAIGDGGDVINVDLSYLDSKIDPRDNLENYQRITASVRSRLRREASYATWLWNISADYTGSFDNAKVDPDLNQRKIDLYESQYNRVGLTSDLTLSPQKLTWIESIALNASANYTSDRLTRQKQVTPNGTPLAPTSMEEGVHDGRYLLKPYLADYLSDGRPVDITLHLKATGTAAKGIWLHKYKAGAEYSFVKNYGDGQVYDLDKPLSGGWTTRPRAFKDIPALHTLSAYVEEAFTLLTTAGKLETQAGARMIALAGLDNRYYLSGKPYVDPRANAEWTFPSFTVGGLPMAFSIGGGYGMTTRMPTVDYLFPQVHYSDFVQLGYYDVRHPEEYSKVNLRTYITDPTNYDLRAARNRKWEVRISVKWGSNRLSVTYFDERLSSGFRYSTVYDTYSYRRYDATAIDPSTLSGPPSVEGLPYTDKTILDGYSRVTNGTRIDKQGIELQLSTARWQPLRTALTVTGAWFHSRYSNSQLLYKPVSTVIGSTPVSDLYVGLYDTTDGRVNDTFTTSLMFDTQIPRWGLIFTTTIQSQWWTKQRRMEENPLPQSYLSAADGALHPYTEADTHDAMLQHLVISYNPTTFVTQKVPTAIYVNLKATKQIGRWLRISAFVNRILDYLPDYTTVNGITVRRTSEAYFGMEATITI